MKLQLGFTCAIGAFVALSLILNQTSSAQTLTHEEKHFYELSATDSRALFPLPSSPENALSITSTYGEPYLSSAYQLSTSSKGYLKITASTNMYVSVFTTGSVDTTLCVYPNSSLTTRIASDDDSAHANNAYVNFYIPQGYTYYVEVGGSSASTAGNYGLIVHRGAATSGYEKPTMFSTYNNSTYKEYNNCYTYALGYYLNPNTGKKWRASGQNPGEISGISIAFSDLSSASKARTAIVNACVADAAIYGGDFRSIGKNEQPHEGYYKVALVLDPGTDYHWYRQINEGNWTHKPGVTTAIDTDNSGNTIFYPDSANTGGYTEFLGYYEVKVPSGYASIASTEDFSVNLNDGYDFRNNITTNEIENIRKYTSENDVLSILGAPHAYVGSGFVGSKYIVEGKSYIIYYTNGQVEQIRRIFDNNEYQIILS